MRRIKYHRPPGLAVYLQLEDVGSSIMPGHIQRPAGGDDAGRINVRVENAILFVERARHDVAPGSHYHRITGIDPLVGVGEQDVFSRETAGR